MPSERVISARPRCLLTAVALTVGLVLGPASAGAVPYVFTDIADTTGPISALGIGRFPSINESGQVAFTADLDAGGEATFRGSGGPLTTIAHFGGVDPTGGFGFLGVDPTINNAGVVAFLGQKALSPVTIYTGTGGAPAPIVSIGMFGLVGLGEPAINNAGVLAFVGDLSAPTLFRGSGAPFIMIANGGPPLNGFGSDRVSINSSGVVAFYAPFALGGGGVFTGAGGPLTTIADTSGIFDDFAFSERPSITNSGRVEFVGTLRGIGAQVVATGQGGPLSVVAITGGAFSAFLSTAMNDPGEVAFLATLTAGGEGIFTGPDLFADKVIGIGDPLFGHHVQAFTSRIALNNRGSVAFVAMLDNGTEVLVRADVPGPSTLLLMTAAGVVLAACTQRLRLGRRSSGIASPQEPAQ